MLSLLWSLIVGGVIGAIAQAIVGKGVPGGIIGNIIAGFLGSWIGSYFLRDLGPVIGGFAIIPAILGAMLVVFVFAIIVGRRA